MFWQLDEMCISFDGGKTTLNFAEAALLIQGSACIYSKKVRRGVVVAGVANCTASDQHYLEALEMGERERERILVLKRVLSRVLPFCQGAQWLREITFSLKLISLNSSTHFAMGLREIAVLKLISYNSTKVSMA
jgi:hypothetical protein